MRLRATYWRDAGWVGVTSFLLSMSPSARVQASPADKVAEADASSVDPEAPDAVARRSRHVPGPSLDGWQPQLGPGSAMAPATSAPGEGAVLAVTAFELPLYPEPGAGHAIGTARLGSRLPAERRDGSGCRGGTWYRVSGGAYVCTAEGAVPADEFDAEQARLWSPSFDEPHQFEYARVIADRAPLLSALPSAEEAEELARAYEAGSRSGPHVERWMKGDYFLALAGRREHDGHVYYETVRGRFARAEDLQMKPLVPMHGEHLDDERTLPLAFTLDDTPLSCTGGDRPVPCGTIAKHARFAPGEMVSWNGARYVRGPKGALVPAAAVRIASAIARPDSVPAGRKWVHVDLAQQTLVAYEGDTPVYATLVSSGRDGYNTPRGTFRVERKYLSKTMRGDDDVDGRYEVQEVPWTMYYDGNYALHGAYWHDRFGRTKSHGCVNIPPVDARWLYYWTDTALPTGWHAMFHRRGTYVYISGQTPADGQ
ncbi:L,D-transpeptidase [Haliangium sp.]|uniref:L,D-transpeptidase n=1 Tax=Haliangium sp. TaxID=2663208 RepID=UPI003D1376DF